MPSWLTSNRSKPAKRSVTAASSRIEMRRGRSARPVGELVEGGKRVLERAPAGLGVAVGGVGRAGSGSPVAPGLLGLIEQGRETGQRPHPLGERVTRLWHDPELLPKVRSCCCGSAGSAYRQNALARRNGWRRGHLRRNRSTGSRSGTPRPR